MSNYQKIIPIANKITEKYALCDNCLGRLFSKRLHLSSNKILGKKLNQNNVKKCHVCKNLFDNLSHFLKLMLEKSSGYSFKTFSIGATIKPSIADRDDFIRSQYKLRGIDSIKTDITKEMGKLYSKKTKKTIDHIDPDVTFTINFKEELCDLRSKSVTFSGRYLKSERGLPQKQNPCDNCSGKGCRACDFHGISGYDSVEGAISKSLFQKFGGTAAKFTWIGGEDKSSLVLGSGRPFFVKVQNPRRQKAKFPDVAVGPIRIVDLKPVCESPKKPLRFNSVIRVKISTESQVDSKMLRKLKDLTTCPVVIYEKSGKRSKKKIFDVKYKRNSKNLLTLIVKAEGGLPIKRFVVGDGVTPAISTVLDAQCKCIEFDFLQIKIHTCKKLL